MKKNQNGFITMIVIMLVLVGLVIWFAVNRIIDARNDADDIGTHSALIIS